MKAFTLQELAHYNGNNGTPAFIAYKGKVYDVSGSFTWKTGVHQVLHQAGENLTQVLAEAPHGEDLVLTFPVVGTLRND